MEFNNKLWYLSFRIVFQSSCQTDISVPVELEDVHGVSQQELSRILFDFSV